MKYVAMIALLVSSTTLADVRPAAVFSDHMVLQQQQPIPIWGWAEAGEAVAVRVAKQEKSATADANGAWRVTLEAMNAADHADPLEIVIQGPKSTVTIKDVLIGEVWLCSGQSNMAWTVRQSGDAEAELAAATDPLIRAIVIHEAGGEKPLADAKVRIAWTECTPRSTGNVTAVGYYFGRHLRRELKVPVGLVQAAVNGTYAEAWTSRAALESLPSAKPILERNDKALAEYPTLFPQYQKDIAAWLEKVRAAEAAGQPRPKDPQPRAPLGPNDQNAVAALHNTLIHPLAPFALRGVIWYQGEANVARAYQYRELLPLMINDWRKLWGQEQLPFGIVQLANIGQVNPQVTPSAWAELREAQAMTATSTPHCGLAITIDIGEAANIHPANKQDVGKRLALWALAKVYGKEGVFSGPTFKAVTFDQGSARVTFDHVGGGLAARGDALTGFSVAGDDQRWMPAVATIEGSTVVLKSDAVAKPVAVRYAWTDNPVCNLYNAEGLPAAPFRTDDWPGRTINAR